MSEDGDTNWTVDWNAFREARECKHGTTIHDDPADLFEALCTIRTELSRPTAEILTEEAFGG